jgi:hypothetical protein
MLLVTAPSKLKGAKLDTLLLTKIQVPRKSREKIFRQLVKDYHPRASLPHPKLAAVGVKSTIKCDMDVILDVHDWATAMDAAVSIIFHHIELVNLGGETAATVTNIIEYSNGISDLAENILQQALANQKNPAVKNWAFETPYLDTNLQPTSKSFYNWSDTTKLWMRGPLGDSIKTAKNTASLESNSSNAGVYTVRSGTTSVSVPQSDSSASRNPRANVFPLDDSTPSWTVNNLTPGYGFEQFDDIVFENNTFSISFTNDWLRWLSGYVEFLGPDGAPVNPDGWTSLVPGDLAGTYDSDTKKFVQIFAAVDTILAIPIPGDAVEIRFPWPSNASGVRIMAGGIGRTGGILGEDGVYHGSWDSQICTPGAIMTGVFNFGIPVICMVAGVLIATAPLTELAEKIFSAVLEAAQATVAGPVSNAVSGGGTDTLLFAFADLIPHLLLDIPGLLSFISVEVAEGAAEAATPVFGWIALAASVLADVALLVETSAEIASSPATFELVATRAIDATWTLEPDVNHQNTWPLEATHFEVNATYQDGTTRSTTGLMQSSPQTGPITVFFNKENKNRLPAGGSVVFTARFSSETGFLAGVAKTDSINADIPGDLLTVPATHITENVVPLTSNTVYQFDQKLTFDSTSNQHVLSNEGGAPAATIKNLSASNVGNNLGSLANITLNQQASELGYTWQASGQNLPLSGETTNFSGQMFTFQAINDGTTPEEGLKFVPAGFTAKPILLFELEGQSSGSSFNFWIDPRNSLYHVRQVNLDGTKNPFDLGTGTSWGRFNQQIDAAVIHPSGFVAGINTQNNKIELLNLRRGAVADAQAPLAEIYSGHGTRPGLIHNPVGLAGLPSAGFVVLEEADFSLQGAEARFQAFDFLGNPAPVFAGNSAVAPLKTETQPVTLLDIAMESKGFIFVLKFINEGAGVSDYLLDLYTPEGSFLAQTVGLSAAKITVDLFRTLYTLNFETIQKPDGERTEPSVSIWLPSTPDIV